MKKRIRKTIENMEDDVYGDGYGKCHECKKFGTSECPTSSKCLKFDDRPYFEPKQKEKFTISKEEKIVFLLLLLYILLAFVFGSDGLMSMI